MPTPPADRPEVDLPEKEAYPYEDYQQLPEGTLCELIRGELINRPTPPVRHQCVLGNLVYALDRYADGRSGRVILGPIDVHLSDTTALQPDFAYVTTDRADRIGTHALEGAPDFVAEILSPATERRDRTIKKQLYEVHGRVLDR